MRLSQITELLKKDLLTGKFPKVRYAVENKLTLSGSVELANGSPVIKGKVLLVAKGYPAFTVDTITGSDGHFTFELPEFSGTQQFTIIASSATGNNNIKVNIDPDLPAKFRGLSDQSLETVHFNDRIFGYIALKKQYSAQGYSTIAQVNNHQLKEATVRSKRISLVEQAVADSKNLNGPGNADQIVTYQDLNHCANLEMCLQGKLNGVFFKSEKDPNSKIYVRVPYSVSGMNKPILLVLDGVAIPANQSNLSSIPATEVQSIEVLRTGSRLVAYGMEGSGGVLVITTKTGGIDYNKIKETIETSRTKTPNVVSIGYNGFHINREFYVPAFSSESHSKPRPTIWWKPVVNTDDEGKAVIEFPLGSKVSRFMVKVEGLSDDGKIGYKYQSFQIK